MQPQGPRIPHRSQMTFSILGRIGGDATSRRQRRPARPPPLSVSSVGSEAMQRAVITPASTLKRTFSILGRIGGDATKWPPGRGVLHCIFQYPRSDRRRCNDVLAELSRDTLALSVSSVGSEAMQLLKEHWLHICSQSFSILGRIGGDATYCPGPQSKAAGMLSVSSVGSEAMQPYAEAALREEVETFSILGRIGGDATRTTTWGVLATTDFQYPRSDRRRCNSRPPARCRRRPRCFQYPRSDRRRCNQDCSDSDDDRDGLSVSSVGSEAMQHRFEKMAWVTAFCFQYPRSDRRRCNIPVRMLAGCQVRHFQYPRSDRRRCNHLVSHPSHPAAQLSVSSVGSEAMQLG